MSQEEAEYLIETLKDLLSDEVEIPLNGERNAYEAVGIPNNRNKFDIYIRRGNINTSKCTFIILSKDTKTCLLRLDVVDKTLSHKNPDGTMIYGTHLHLYKEGYEATYAIEFNLDNPNLVNYCVEFLKKINIINIEKKRIIEKMTLFN